MTTAFAGTARFELRRLLGAGGMGVVYAAYDREYRCEVALKVLPSLGPVAAERIKREFRIACGTHHPNLVSLGELIGDDGHLFFTMELVGGVDWLSYVRGQSSPSRIDARYRDAHTHTQSQTVSISALDPGAPFAGATPDEAEPHARVDGHRLRTALQQLVCGLAYLHAHGKVHRDVKPSNVLVSDEGRVVLLDFGLAVDLSSEIDVLHRTGGTALYMSPEQASGSPSSPASDWYSVGVLLYEALTGRLPFHGTRAQVLAAKQLHDAEPPTRLLPGAPGELSDLCLSLLARDPGGRASSTEILAVISGSRSPATGATVCAPVSGFVGRDQELAAMLRAFEEAADKPLALVVEGESGVGKTTLVSEFCRRLETESHRSTLVCRGTCSERESVPFKALDGVAESLAQQYPSIFPSDAPLAPDARSATLAAQAAALAFPVFGRRAETTPPNERSSGWDAWQQQHLAFQGVRDLLAIVAHRRRLVLCIDDWQWVDADSVRLLSHVLAMPAPPLLLVLATRPGAHPPSLPCALGRIVLCNLELESAERLAERLLRGASQTVAGSLARAIATESLGHPLFIAALARQVIAGEERKGQCPDLDAAIRSRFEALPATARAAAELLAVSRAPLQRAVLQTALSFEHGAVAWPELTSTIVRLTLENLARADGVRATDTIDCFHSRVAASILLRLPDGSRRQRHRALALALEEHKSTDFESMTDHWVQAADQDRGATYALRAAEEAEGVLAFERAARFYQRSLELCPEQRDRAGVQRRLAAALGNTGRGRSAADAYLAAASGTAGEQRIELHRLAADQLFRSGYVNDALQLIEHVFPAHGLLFPRSSAEAFLWLALYRLAIRFRGIDFASRPADSIDPSELARVDAAWTVAIGLSTVDNLKGASIQSGHLRLALRLGEPLRVLRALAAEAAYLGTVGVRSKRRVDELLTHATALAAEIDDPYALGFVHLARCFALYLRSEFEAARAAGEDAEAVFERRPVMASWELTSARMLVMGSHFYCGDLSTIRQRVPELVREAEGRGDIYAATCLRLAVSNSAWLIDDESDEARRQLRIADDSWHYEGVHLQQCWSLLAWVHLDLYEGDPEQAHARVRRCWGTLTRSFIMRFELLRAELLWLRGRAALAYAERSMCLRRALLAEAAGCGARLMRESAPWAPAVGHLVMAGVHGVRGERPAARARFQRAVGLAQACGMGIIGRAHRQWMGDDRGLAQVKRPDRWVRMIAPGLPMLPN